MAVTVNGPAAGIPSSVSGAGSNSAYILGDSLAANAYVTTGVTFYALAAEGFFIHANNLLGAPFNFIGSGAVGGKTAAQVLTEQVPAAIASGAKYAFVSMGTNDINAELVSGQVCAERVIAVIEALQAGGMIPVWSTIPARTFGTTARLNAMLECNDRLRRYAYLTRNAGIFWDAWRHTVDNTSTQCDARAGLWYDSAPNLHPDNVGGYYLGKALASVLRPLIKFPPIAAYGAEDLTNAPTRLSNLLANPYFSGTGGTVSANCTGTMPTSWTVDWATRTGTGSLAASIVDVTDSQSGLATAKAIQLVLSGSPAANDVIRITQASGMNSSLAGGDIVSAECNLTLTAPTLMNQIAMRFQTNTAESTWNGVNNQAAGAYPEGFSATYRTRDMPVSGSGAASQARFDVRITCSGAATGTILMSLPRVRKGAS